MAEIVRLLKWRAEWDGADLIAGTEKAAAAGERLQKAIQEVGDVGAPALKKTSAAAKETDEAFEGLGIEAKQVEMYLGRLEKGSGSPLVLQRNAELAAAAMNVMTQAAARAGQEIPTAFSGRVATAIETAKTQAAGMNAELEKMGGQTPTKLDKVIVALEQTNTSSANAAASMRQLAEAASAIERSGGATLGLATATEKTAASAATAATSVGGLKDQTMGFAKSTMAASGAVGPFGEILEKLGASGSGAASKLASVAFQGVAVGAALKLGYDAGTKFNQFLEQHGNYLAKAIDGTVNWVSGLKSEQELLSALPIAVNSAIRAKQILAQETGATLTELEREMGGWKSLDEVRRKAIEQAGLISQRYTQLKTAGKDWRAEMELQAPAINATTDTLLKLGVNLAELPLGFVTASRHAAEFDLRLRAAEQAATANEVAIGRLAKAEAEYGRVATASAAEIGRATAAFDAKMRALNELTLSEEEYSARKQAAYAEMAAATERATQAEQAAAEKAKTSQKEVQEALDTTPEKFAEVQRAAETFNAELEKGATPAAAMKEALEGLAAGIAESAKAIDTVGSSLNTINFGDMAVNVKTAAQAAAEAGANLGTMASGLDSIVGSGGRAVDILNRLEGAFQRVAAASAAAGGGGGPTISNAGPGAPVEMTP